MYFWDVLGGVEHIHTLLILLSKISFTFLFFFSSFFLHNQQIFVLQYILNILLSNIFLVQGHFTLQEMFYLYRTLISLIKSLRRALYHIQCVVLWTGG